MGPAGVSKKRSDTSTHSLESFFTAKDRIKINLADNNQQGWGVHRVLKKLIKKIIWFLIYSLDICKTLDQKPMKKALQITGKILYFIIAMSPIFALGYMLGMKL